MIDIRTTCNQHHALETDRIEARFRFAAGKYREQALLGVFAHISGSNRQLG